MTLTMRWSWTPDQILELSLADFDVYVTLAEKISEAERGDS
ncbi:hypothetical protein ACIOD2_32425 [Amycolatopsis sp. NPDC088138]